MMRVTLIEELVQFKNEIATYSTYTNQACIATSPSMSSCHVALPRRSNAGDTGDEVRSSELTCSRIHSISRISGIDLLSKFQEPFDSGDRASATDFDRHLSLD